MTKKTEAFGWQDTSSAQQFAKKKEKENHTSIDKGGSNALKKCFTRYECNLSAT